MTSPIAPLSTSAARMRQEFDSTFAALASQTRASRESLIAIRAGGEALAVRTLDITGIAKRKRVVPLPSLVSGLLGITAVRGVLVPAYDLAVLLGLSGPGGKRAWIAFVNRDAPVGLVFDEFEGQVEFDDPSLSETTPSDSREHLRRIAKIGVEHRAVIDIAGLVEAIRNGAGLMKPAKE